MNKTQRIAELEAQVKTLTVELSRKDTARIIALVEGDFLRLDMSYILRAAEEADGGKYLARLLEEMQRRYGRKPALGAPVV